MAVLLVACDAHRDFPDTAMKPCHILCTDGNVMSYADYEKSGKQAIAVVFHINQREDVEGNGYAVYLWDIAPESFADSIGVAQMRLLYAAKAVVNPIIEKCGGDPLPDETNDCWYWTSTEVKGQQTAKAWLYSLGSGAMQETPKIQAHRARPIITLND